MDDDQNGRQFFAETIDSLGRQKLHHPETAGNDAHPEPVSSNMQRRLDATQEIAGIGDWEYDAATGNVTWSRSVFNLLKRDPLSGNMTFDEYLFYYYPDDSERLLETMETVILENERHEIEMRARLLHGEIVRHRCTLIPLPGQNHVVTAINGFLQNLNNTENDVMEAETGISETRLLAVNTRDVVFRVLLPDCVCEYISTAVLEVSGHPPLEWYSNPFLIRKILHPGWRDRFVRIFNDFLSGNGPEEHLFPIVHASGELRWVLLRVTALRDRKGGIFAAEGIVSDITARMREKSERKRLIRQLRKALAGARILSGLLPICSFCKKVRDDQGYWTQIESFITEHSDVFFTHGLCPQCLEVNYPEYSVKRATEKEASAPGKPKS